ncbi:hypothetical protein DOTSEDRAFT_167352 [Dothistroma septosporum NZE10]|uniref:Aminoglycoside phosphotransferase domain-containing protein n=1 Tax=Dothistroma septosporum (strain NZE10 / CBS 128990) TaxID=675120 RepID=N1PY47_DOTSN|nr:hypothetical protein DOTSEDRAFT_167352 [Dothistroma septosporum NZE10]
MLPATEVTDLSLSNSFSHETVQSCLDFASKKYPGHLLTPLSQQGGCSFTIVAHTSAADDDDNQSIMIQFRIPRFALSPTIAHESRALYGNLVPALLSSENLVTGQGNPLQVYAMTFISGVRLSDVQPSERCLGERDLGRMFALVDGMAKFFAMGWEKGVMRRAMNGRVGKSLMQRLRNLERDLPVEWMRGEAGSAADAVERGVLEFLPVVLNHGDLLPSNIMVDGESWGLSGLVDWAEAEYLSFGMALYGVEHLLGFETHACGLDAEPHFTYYDEADELRDRFWTTLLAYVPELANARVQTAVLLSRQIGIMLWHGFAWDDGKIDRVVNELNDRQEMAYLEVFLRASTGQERSKL